MFSKQNDAPVLALSEQLVAELIASNLIVIEVPMYNFGIPSALKAWIDHVARYWQNIRLWRWWTARIAHGQKGYSRAWPWRHL